MTSDTQANSFLETQFFFYLIPSYYGIAAFIYRYFTIIVIDPSYYIKKIPLESIFKMIQSEEEKGRVSETLTYKVLPASYIIKSKLCLLNSYMYLLMIILSFICPSSLFYGANHKPQSFLYLFGFIAWYGAALILRREQQRNMSQSIWIHRLFWILAGTFSTYKMFEDYFLPINIFINIFFIPSNLVLAIYGIYRPEDSETLDMIYNQDMPGFVKIFFQTLELNSTVVSLFQIEDPINQNFRMEDKEFEKTREDISQEDLLVIEKSFKHSAQNIKQEINLLNELPRRNIFVDKKVRYIKVNDKFKSCYFMLTQIAQARFEAERTYEQFIELTLEMGQIFNQKNFPKHILPRISDIVTPSQLSGVMKVDRSMAGEHSNKAQIVQIWLQEVMKTPIFMVEPLLVFLKIGQEESAPFITYFEYSYKMLCSKNYLICKHKEKKNQQKETIQRKSIAENLYENQGLQEKSGNEILLELIKNKLEFAISIDSECIDEDQFSFIINCQVDSKLKYNWIIRKTEENIVSLNQRIEDECACSVPYFYNRVASVKLKSHKSKLEVYRGYIELLLKNRQYYCNSLFFFIRFDPVKIEINLTGNQLSYSVPEASARQSRYLSQYEDKGTLIEVLRLDRIDRNSNEEDIYKFTVRRKDQTINNKRTNELKELRSKLSLIYKGVSFIPEIQFKDCHKFEVKNKIEAFLLKIQNLPKIQINQDFCRFYGQSELQK